MTPRSKQQAPGAAPGQGRGLDQETIIARAIEQLDRAGMARFSLRGLAASMGVPVTSLYWHISNRDTLLALARDTVSAEVDVPDVSKTGWRHAVGGYARSLHAMVLRHPWVVDTSANPMPMGSQTLALTERVFTIFQAPGYSGTDLVHANSLVTAHAVGSAVLEAATTSAREAAPPATPVEGLVADEDTVNRQARFGLWWQTNRDHDLARLQREGFEFGLTRILDSLDSTGVVRHND